GCRRLFVATAHSSTSAGPTYESDSHSSPAHGGGDRQPGRSAGLRQVGRATRPVRTLLPPCATLRPHRTSISRRSPGRVLNRDRAGPSADGALRQPAGGGVPVLLL